MTNVSRLTALGNNTLGNTTFRLDKNSGGGPLVSGSAYFLRVRPQIGTRFMGYSNARAVVPARASGFETAWPDLAGNATGDSDQDGIPNLVEYALGLNPTTPTSPASLPQPSLTGAGLALGFNVPPNINDLTYAAECTTDFSAWQAVANSGSATAPLFRVPLSAGPKCFLRLRVSQQPAP